MGEEKSRSLTRKEFEAAMKRASNWPFQIPTTAKVHSTRPRYSGSRVRSAFRTSTFGEPWPRCVGGTAFGVAGLVGRVLALPVTPALMSGGLSAVVIVAVTARITGRDSRRAREEVQREIEGVLDRLEQGEDLAPPPASWRRWVMDQARRFQVEISGSKGD